MTQALTDSLAGNRKCSAAGCKKKVYGGWDLCEAHIHEMYRAKAEAAAPGLKVKFWSPRGGGTINGFLPTLERAYVKLNGEDVGYVDCRRSPTSPSGYYENHRAIKGEVPYRERINCANLAPEVESLILAALSAIRDTEKSATMSDLFVPSIGGYLA